MKKTTKNKKVKEWSRKITDTIREIITMSEIRLSNNVLMIIAVLLIAVNAISFAWVNKDMITGKAGAESGEVYVCIGPPPSIETPGPTTGTIVNETYIVNISANNTATVQFNYYKFGQPEVNFASDNDTNNDSYYNATFNITKLGLPDGNCNYRISARSFGYCGDIISKGSGVFSVNKFDVEPTWTEFMNNLSTNFSTYSSWTNIPNPKIGIPNAGIVNIYQSNLDDADLDKMFEISPGEIVINATEPCFGNTVYRLSFLNLTKIVEPMVLKDGTPCGSNCYDYTYENESLIFLTLLGLSGNFSIVEGANLTLNLSLDVEGFDVDLNWTYHLNNPYSTPPDYYNIYYGSNVTEMLQLSSPFPTPNVTGITSLNWTDTDANSSDERYYVLTAVKGTREARAIETGCKYDVKAYKGQNLISLPCQKESLNIDSQIVPPHTSYYDRIVRYNPGTGFQRTDYYGPTWKWWGAFDEVNNDVGYYLYPTKADYEIASVGIVPEEQRNVSVYNGLNFLGWTSVFTKGISGVLNPGSANDRTTITRYNSTTNWQRVDYYDGYGWYGWFNNFDPGRGYWFYPVNQDYNWTYDPLP